MLWLFLCVDVQASSFIDIAKFDPEFALLIKALETDEQTFDLSRLSPHTEMGTDMDWGELIGGYPDFVSTSMHTGTFVRGSFADAFSRIQNSPNADLHALIGDQFMASYTAALRKNLLHILRVRTMRVDIAQIVLVALLANEHYSPEEISAQVRKLVPDAGCYSNSVHIHLWLKCCQERIEDRITLEFCTSRVEMIEDERGRFVEVYRMPSIVWKAILSFEDIATLKAAHIKSIA